MKCAEQFRRAVCFQSCLGFSTLRHVPTPITLEGRGPWRPTCSWLAVLLVLCALRIYAIQIKVFQP